MADGAEVDTVLSDGLDLVQIEQGCRDHERRAEMSLLERIGMRVHGYTTEYLDNGHEVYTYRDGHKIEADAEGIPLKKFDIDGSLIETFDWNHDERGDIVGVTFSDGTTRSFDEQGTVIDEFISVDEFRSIVQGMNPTLDERLSEISDLKKFAHLVTTEEPLRVAQASITHEMCKLRSQLLRDPNGPDSVQLQSQLDRLSAENDVLAGREHNPATRGRLIQQAYQSHQHDADKLVVAEEELATYRNEVVADLVVNGGVWAQEVQHKYGNDSLIRVSEWRAKFGVTDPYEPYGTEEMSKEQERELERVQQRLEVMLEFEQEQAPLAWSCDN
ncbi:MAG TPA: hypothetical protein VIJ40_02335 [Acidimicrobiales bacterium]